MIPKSIGILIFPDAEVLDVCGPFEVLSTAESTNDGESLFRVNLIAESSEPLDLLGGLTVTPQATLANCPPLDLLLVPGGQGRRRISDGVVEWVRARAKTVERMTSVCTGAFVLARAGLLDGRRATTHWTALEELRESFPSVIVVDDLHVADEDDLITSAGISAGIDLALRLVEIYGGKDAAVATARNMEYRYPEDNSRRV